jgi:hypothetical protein
VAHIKFKTYLYFDWREKIDLFTHKKLSLKPLVPAGRWKNHAQRTEIVLFLAGLLAIERTTLLLHDAAHSSVLGPAIKTLFLYADWSLLYSSCYSI